MDVLGFLLVHVAALGQQALEVVGAHEARVAVLLEQQPVHVVGGVVQRVPRPAADALRHALRRRAVDVDLARRAGLQELPASWQMTFVYIYEGNFK